MAGECDRDVDKEEIKTTEKTENIRDENLLEEILVNPHPKSKTVKTDSLAEMLNVSNYLLSKPKTKYNNCR